MNIASPKPLRWLCVALVLACASAQGQVAITSGLTLEEYVNDILLGEGVTASNITFTGDPMQIGFLTEGEGTIFPIDEGIVLNCDPAINPDPNQDDIFVIDNPVSGDQDLLDIANSVPDLIGQNFSVGSVNDLAVLEFDFVATGDSISFDYVFGSDEYLTYVNTQYNDIFAFLLSGPGLAGPYASPPEFPDGAINIAQIPDTDPPLPITISSVNNVSYEEYYIDNQSNTDIELNGFTTVLTAAEAVQCGETYHIKLAIADGTDTALESIVCLEAGSFTSSNPANIASETFNSGEIDLPASDVLEGCLDGTFVVSINTEVFDLDTLFFEISGTAENGVDYEPIDDYIVVDDEFDGTTEVVIVPIDDGILEGGETVTLSYVFENTCGLVDTTTATLNILDQEPLVVNVEDIVVCLGNPATAVAEVTGGVQPYGYSWTSGGNGPTEDFDTGGGIMYTVTVSDPCNNEAFDSFTVGDPESITAVDPTDLFVCPDAIELASAEVTGGTAPYSFEWSSGGSGDEEPFEYGNAGTYTVTVTDNCQMTFQAQFQVADAPLLTSTSPVEETYCVGIPTEPLFFGGLEPIVYTFDPEIVSQDGQGFAANAPGFYTITATDACDQVESQTPIWMVCDTWIPNVFSPGGDGMNDFFVIDGLVGFPGSSLTIFNRWGNVVFEDTNYLNNWDGKDPNGNKLSEGTYYYVFNRADGENYSGYVMMFQK